MRALFTLSVALIAAAGLNAAPADAKDSKYRYKPKYVRVVPPSRCDHTCIRARHQDPAGNYAAYPDWARVAFTNSSPKASRR